MAETRGRFSSWWHRTCDDWAVRAMIGPAQVRGAVQGCDQDAREQRERARLARDSR